MTTPTLTWRDIDDVLGIPGWGLRVGFTVEREPGDAPTVWIHEAEINTGHRVIDLCARDLPNVAEIESRISEDLDVEDSQASFELAHPERRDDYPGLGMFVDSLTRSLL